MITLTREKAEQVLAALDSCTPGDYSTGHVIHPSFDDTAISSATVILDSALAETREPHDIMFYCNDCKSVQRVCLDHCTDSTTNEKFTDLVCDHCHSITTSFRGHVAVVSHGIGNGK